MRYIWCLMVHLVIIVVKHPWPKPVHCSAILCLKNLFIFEFRGILTEWLAHSLESE